MSDQPKPNNRSLSEISHLFLSSVRDRQTNGAPRPLRRPPASAGGQLGAVGPVGPGGFGAQQPGGKQHVSIDLTPEELAQVLGHVAGGEEEASGRVPPVTAVIAAHLNGHAWDRVREYARHVAADGRRVGVMEVDAAEFRITCFDCGVEDAGEAGRELAVETFDPRAMRAAIEELNWDLDRWLLVLPHPRVPEARAMLREVDRWVLLSTCDHDGVVGGYRTLKGLAEGFAGEYRPRLKVALLDAPDEAMAARVHQKLTTVCVQFLGWEAEPEGVVTPAEEVAEHPVMCCRPVRDKGQLATTAVQWQIVGEFLSRAKQAAAEEAKAEEERVAKIEAEHREEDRAAAEAGEPVAVTFEDREGSGMDAAKQVVADVVIPIRPVGSETATVPGSAVVWEAPAARADEPRAERSMEPIRLPVAEASPAGESEVIDLPGGEVNGDTILAAVMRHEGGGLVEVPVGAPMCPEARLAVGRDRRLVLVAVARQGLIELRNIGRAYRWLMENRGLVGMAVPQFAIDARALPVLRLLVDQSDLSAEVLSGVVQSGNVVVQAYRRLRWGSKVGLMLEAA